VLTTGADDFPGTAGRDKFVGAIGGLSPTFGATDKIDGAAGNDRLELTQNAAFTGLTTGSVKNVETLQITNAMASAATFDAKNITGVETLSITSSGAGFTITNVNSGLKAINLNTGGNARSIDTNYTISASERDSTSTPIALGLSTVGKSATTATDRSTVDLKNIQTLNTTLTGANFVNFGADVRNLNVSGSGDLDAVFATSSAIRTVDGSAATGVLKINLSNAGTGLLTSVKTGAGNDSITLNAQGAVANATIAGGDGTDTLTLGNVAAAANTVQYAMTGVENLVLGGASNTFSQALTFAGTNVSGLSKITTSSATAEAVTFADMKAAALTFSVSGTSGDTRDITSDHSGATTLEYARTSTQATGGEASAPSGDFTFSDSGSVTINVGAHVSQVASLVTANKATSVTLNITSGKTAAGVEQTSFGTSAARITANEATSLTINNTGVIGSEGSTTAAPDADTEDAAEFAVPKAKSVTITNGANAGFIALHTEATGATKSSLETLTITTGAAMTVQAENSSGATNVFDGLKTLTIAANKGATTISGHLGTTADAANAPLAALNVATLSGTGTDSKVVLGALGNNANAYDLTINATGLKGGLTTGAIAITPGKDVTLNLEGTTGNVLIGTSHTSAGIGTSDYKAGNVTIKAAGIGSGQTAGKALEVETIFATGTVSIDASGTRAPTIGTIEGKDVTVNFANTTATTISDDVVNPTVGSITASNSANLTLFNLAGNSATISNTSATAASFNVTVNGGVGVDTVTINAEGAAMASVVVSGNLGASDDILTVNGGGSKAKSINISALESYDRANIYGSTGADTIFGGSGNDTIVGGRGADQLSGGGGKNTFLFELTHSDLKNGVTKIIDLKATDSIAIGVVDGKPVLVGGSGSSGDGTGTITSAVFADTTINAKAVVVATNGFAQFSTASGSTAAAYADLNQKVALLNQAITNKHDGIYFLHNGTMYFYAEMAGGTTEGSEHFETDLVIELVGVTSLGTTPSQGTTPTTGLIGVGA
jgi:hypothetical protein